MNLIEGPFSISLGILGSRIHLNFVTNSSVIAAISLKAYRYLNCNNICMYVCMYVYAVQGYRLFVT